jgi:predicted acylesterase/phospholipase RssA
MTTALALSGGAAQGSFEVGALQYLYEREFVAKIICTTSVGSVNGLQLAHGGTGPTQAAAFNTLKTIWETELTFNQDMYNEAPWLAGVGPATRQAIADLVSGSMIPLLFTETPFLSPGQKAWLTLESLLKDLPEVIKGLSQASSVFTLDPTRQKIKQHLDPGVVAKSGVELRLVTVSLDSGAIRYVKQDGRVIETDGRPVADPNPNVCKTERNAYNAARAAREAASKAADDAPKDKEATHDFQVADAAAARAKEALDQCISASLAAGEATQLTVNVLDGAIASSSIPCVFPPTMLGDQAYVDGGIRWTLPLLTAVDFDPELIVAIITSPPGVPLADHAYRNATILDIAERAVLGLELGETVERHLQAARLLAAERRQKVWVISPRVLVHSGFTIDPGLIDINIAYGYMCAADVTTAFPFPALVEVGAGPRQRPIPVPKQREEPLFVEVPTDKKQSALADAIALCRIKCWQIEHHVFGYEIPLAENPFAPQLVNVGPPKPGNLVELRMMKELLGLLVDARRESGGRLPPGASAWADNWERHRWVPAAVAGAGATPWASFSWGGVELQPAATRQTNIVAQAPGQAEVYLVNPLRHWITTPDALNQFGGWGVVRQVRAEYLDAIPRGDDIV